MNTFFLIIRYSILVCVAYSLLSCNKDEGNSPQPVDKTIATPPPATVNEQLLLQMVNEVRTSGCNCGDEYFAPVNAVSWNEQLESAALNHSTYMNKNNVLSHTGENASDAGERIEAVGYAWSSYGENVASGYTREEEVLNGWLNSQGHCRNIMNGRYKEMGVARSGDYWTQLFASPR